MAKVWITLALLCLPGLSQAGIYRCLIDGVETYQSRPCPAKATEADDVSHLQAATPSYQTSVPAERIYNDYRNDIKQIKEDYKTRRYLMDRKHEAEKNQRDRDNALEKARAYNAQKAQEKADRDRQWQEERDKRKARNNGTYRYYDFNHN